MEKRVQSLSLVIGSLLAIVIVCTQLFHFQINPSKKEVKTEQQSSQPADESVVSLSSYSLPSPVHVSINLDAHCLFEIIFEETRENVSPAEAPLSPEKLFLTLFRVIISPNAP